MAWLTGLFTDPTTAPAAYGLIGLLLVLVAVFALTRMRHARRGMFVTGGRKHRLAVVDATAVDNRRRLVLVRRDSVEHLLLIGGHNDLVIEDGIAVDTDKAPLRKPRLVAPAPSAAAPQPPKQPESQTAPAHPLPPVPEPMPIPDRRMTKRPAQPAPPAEAPPPSQPAEQRPPAAAAPQAAAPSSAADEAERTIEAEMERLLGGIVDGKDNQR